jgi:sugar/nucleoside kinase (ribokinase family)
VRNLSSSPVNRSGLLAGGNFIVDNIALVDRYPEQDTLANIESETPSNGGGPFNILRDLRALQAPFPLGAIGLVGKDAHGDWIEQTCREDGIDHTQIHRHETAATSHTHVMTVNHSGRRTFFHHRGANSHLVSSHFEFQSTTARLFYLGYLLLLDGLDEPDPNGRTGASVVLEQAKQTGLETVVDLVSVTVPNFREIVAASIPHIDHLILNEVEATQFIGTEVGADDRASLQSAAQQILDCGVGEAVIIHTAAGSVVASHSAPAEAMGSLELPPEAFRGANGAGDAFAAGYLFGLHENWAMAQRLRLATCAAACSITHPSPSAGVRPLTQCMALAEQYPSRTWRTDPARAALKL